MRPFWNPLIKGFHLMVLWGFKYEFEKMAWHLNWNNYPKTWKVSVWERKPRMHLLACLLPCQLALCQLRNFLCEFNEKYFAIFDQSRCAICISHDIACSYFLENLLVSFFLWYDFKVLVKLKGGGTFLCLAFLCLLNIQQSWFFKVKAKYPVFHFLDLDGTILNLI